MLIFLGAMDDPALVRRYGVDHGILERDPATQIYRRIQ